nr:MAG TPA: hypothetical protein [Caudoviricetes sp.]
MGVRTHQTAAVVPSCGRTFRFYQLRCIVS